ncbi:aminotransferase [Coralliovum pocilloporae]|uniref:aminotransferase n=1 Tax=Coralliovum pocilloporae TaxID=3066369 RepID=UPI003306E183
MKPTSSTYTGMPTTVFEVMSGLAREHGSINLGQGFPDTDGPEDIRRVAADALMEGPNQYPPMVGIPELRQAVAAANKRFYGLDVDWQREVCVTSGATEAISDCINALVEPGDEVVLIEPLYDCYLPLVEHAGGIVKSVRITPPDWTLDLGALEAAFSEKTKLLLLNSPHNPAGKVFSQTELQAIADLLLKYDAYAVCDEVYEHLTFDGRRHIPLMTLDGMRDRVARIGSAGKTFSLTGWKIGYITAAPNLLDPIAKAHQFCTFTTPPNLQKAVAYGLNKGDDYFTGFTEGMQAQRDHLAKGLADIGFEVAPCEGTYFITVDARSVGLDGTDVDLCRDMTVEGGVTAVPVSAFYRSDAPTHFLRFCFCKQTDFLDSGLERLAAWVRMRRG